MKSLSRILTICLFSVPFVSSGAHAAVATTAGHNLTAYHTSNTYNNQWATLSNGREEVGVSAKADFGNCNALILRCAQPKCGNGGCTDMNVASAIVAGCVQSNKVCQQYGNDLVSYMSAQLVANSNAKVNAQNAANAQAAEAAQAAQQQQLEQMQAQMQSQMAQMQQQIAEQNAQTQQQVQSALNQQAQQNQATLDSMAAAAAANAAAQQEESGVTAYQQEAIDRGISEEILARKTITGQIMTEIENAEISLKEVKTAMLGAFEYAGCDTRGNNCTGPKRVKKFRELALNFIDPYDNVIDRIYDALSDAQMVGVDLSEIYLMLNDSCNRWGKYLCPMGTVVYDKNTKGQRGAPKVCDNSAYLMCSAQCTIDFPTDLIGRAACNARCYSSVMGSPANCQPCTLLETLTNNDDVYTGWINAETTSTENQTVIACASAALEDSFIGRRTRRKRGVDIVDIDYLERWLSQVEPGSLRKGEVASDVFEKYCAVPDDTELRKSMLSKTLTKDLCVDNLGSARKPTSPDECPYINKLYALCDTHLYNADHYDTKDLKNDSSLRATMKEIIALKTTVITEQMYKQYEFLSATLRRLKIHLEKSVLSANLQAAGGLSGGGSSSGNPSSGGYNNSAETHVVLKDAESCSDRGEFKDFADCLQANVSLIKDQVNSNSKQACLQLQYTLDEAHNRFIMEDFDGVNILTGGRWSKCKDFFNKTPTMPTGRYSAGEPGEVYTGKTCKISTKDKSKIIGCANEIMERANAIKRKLGK